MQDSWSLENLFNIGQSLTETAKRLPDQIAVAAPSPKQPKKLLPGKSYRYDQITFAELESRSNRIANGLKKSGIGPGVRIALMVPPGINFVAHVFALFKTGAVVILIDPGMGKSRMIDCLAEAKPDGMVGIAKAHLARVLFRKKFPDCKRNVVVEGRFPRCARSALFLSQEADQFEPPSGSREDEAAIIFTTGSTGPPKGVLYRHRIFIEQAAQIRDYFDIGPGSVDVSGFPLFALFNTAMGTTTVFPEMDPTRPAHVYPPNIIDAVTQFQANQSFGSPALWNTVSRYCQTHNTTLPTVKRILTAGAPVPPDVLTRVKKIIHPEGEAFTPYGATESLPVACTSATTVINETSLKTNAGAGTCVGNKFEKIQWRLVEISDDPIAEISQTREVPQGEIGELLVKGPVVTDRYVTQTDANALHKVKDGDSFWHRIGDVGYFDEHDRFWFCGRKGHRVITQSGTMFTVPCEAIINTHPQIYRTALVGVGSAGNQTPVLIVEPLPQYNPTHSADKDALLKEIRELASQHWQTNAVEHFLIHDSLPVDIRHNSKIFREQLRGWAKDRI